MRNEAYLNELLQREVATGQVSGAQLRVLKNGKEIYRYYTGMADMEAGVPVKEDTIYRMYSMTKPVTAVAAMILYERGLLDLYAPVSQYLPAYRGQKVLTEQGLVDAEREVTIRDLMNMTAGIVYPDMWFAAGREMENYYQKFEEARRVGKEMTTREFMDFIAGCPLEFQPGERWRYGACADVMGAVIEIISGKKYSEFLQEEIFTPLDMKDTAFYVPEEKWHRFAQGYEYNEAEQKLVPLAYNILALGDYRKPPAFESAGAGLVSTVEDYSHFALMLANGGEYNGVRMLGRKTVDFLATNQLTEAQLVSNDWESLRGYGYGNFMRTLLSRAKAASNGTEGEFGWDGWCGTYVAIDRAEDLVILYFIQRAGGGVASTVRKIRDIVYAGM
ncbi:MAG: beta-lactamase family protein [Lachnospiraceae bacterium]|nr:beta-lactamase family protein [Lachnospiraceae bacterium]